MEKVNNRGKTGSLKHGYLVPVLYLQVRSYVKRALVHQCALAAHLAAPRRAATEDDDLFTYVGGEGAGGDVQEVKEEFGCEKVEADGSRADDDRGVP